jgi:hypothetical protein
VETTLKKTLGVEGRTFHCYLTKPGAFADVSAEKSFAQAVANVSRTTNIPIKLVFEHESMFNYALNKGYIPIQDPGIVLVIDLGETISSCSIFSVDLSIYGLNNIHLDECTPLDADGDK